MNLFDFLTPRKIRELIQDLKAAFRSVMLPSRLIRVRQVDLVLGQYRRDGSGLPTWVPIQITSKAPSLARTFKCKSFKINNMHGEGIEPPTYWV